MAHAPTRRYCIVPTCHNSRTNTANITFFSLPTNPDRLRNWLTLVQRTDLLQRGELKHRSFEVCAAHFRDGDFRTVTKLVSFALPSKNLPCGSPFLDAADSNVVNSDSQIEEETRLLDAHIVGESSKNAIPNKRKCDDDLLDGEDVKKKRMEDYVKIKKEHEAKNLVTVSAPLNDDEITELLVEWQNNMENRKNSQEYYYFSFNVFLSSPHIYISLRSILRLPNERRLKKVVLHSRSKLDERMLSCLSAKLQALPEKAKYCTLCIDQMPLKPHLFYNIRGDEIFGVKNIGLGSNKLAGCVYVAVLRGIVVDWSQPIAHCMLDRTDSNDLNRWLMEMTDVLLYRGIEVKAFVSKFDLRPDLCTNSTRDKPYIMYRPCNSQKYHKIAIIWDIPDLVSRIRQYLMENDFVNFKERKIISWKYIVEAYNHQKKHYLKLLPEVTMENLEVNTNVSQENSVKQTEKIFSQSMVAAINVLAFEYGQNETSPPNAIREAKATSNFVETVNKAFNILNSSSIKQCKKYERPFTGSESQTKALNDAIDMFNMLRVMPDKPGDSKSLCPLFVHIQESIEAIRHVFCELQAEGISFMLTQRLNQEPVDNVIKEVKKETGTSRNPTPIQFFRAFNKVILRCFLKKSPTRKKQADLADLLLEGNSVILKESASQLPYNMVSIGPETDYQFDLPDKDAVTYVASYLLYKCMTKHVCEALAKIMNISPDLYRVHPHFMELNKNSPFYGRLKLPPKLFVNYITQLDASFISCFQLIVHRRPANVLFKSLQGIEPCTPCVDFNVEYLLKLFTRMRMYQIVKYTNDCIRRPAFMDYKLNRIITKVRYIQFCPLSSGSKIPEEDC